MSDTSKEYSEKTKAIAKIVFRDSLYRNLGFDPLSKEDIADAYEHTERVINGGEPNDGMCPCGPIIRAASEAWDEAIEHDRLMTMRALIEEAKAENEKHPRADSHIMRLMRADRRAEVGDEALVNGRIVRR